MEKNYHILIVDDSLVVMNRMITYLQSLPEVAKLSFANDFDDAIRLLEQNSFHIVLLDINLKVKSGIELLKIIKEKQYPVGRIIMITDDASPEKRALCMELGADYFLNKFSEFEKLAEIIATITIVS